MAKKTKKKVTESNSSISTKDTKLPLTSMNISDERLEQLKVLFPEVFAENQIDFDKLKAALGEQFDTGPERYGLNWAGKRDAFHNVQTLSTGTLRPAPDESVNFDSTENVIIEGDNLEVLKLLQKSYYGKIKMVYIDPPYNTGNEFIYPDDFREGLQTYLRYTKQVSEEGIAQTTNKETSGRFHSIWLNMMYPRLYLARNLLRDDGVIFISIDDNEVDNLRLLLDEIYGEENFLGQIVWKSRQYQDARTKTKLSTDHEYILVYARYGEYTFRGIERDETKFSNPDNAPRGPWMSRSILGLATQEQRPNLHYSITDSVSGNTFAPPEERGWRYSVEKMQKLIADDCILFPTKADGRPREKKFRADILSEFISFPSIIDDVYTADGTAEVRNIFGSQIYDFPKPTGLIRRLVEQTCKDNDIVLDFFAGSGTTAHAVIDYCRENNVKTNFIVIQLPEPTGNPEYPTISEITKERIRHAVSSNFVIRKTKKNQKQLLFDTTSHDVSNKVNLDLGFKIFKLDSSNFSLWDGEKAIDPEQLVEQLRLYADHVKTDRSQLDILYEILIKTGFPLTVQIEEQEIGKLNVFNIESGELIICLEDAVTKIGLRAIVDAKPRQVICLDSAFQHNDQLKTNTVLEMKSHAITFHTV